MFVLHYLTFALMFLLAQISELSLKARTSFVLLPVTLDSIYMFVFF